MTIDEIKNAVDSGLKVCVCNSLYTVEKFYDEYFIVWHDKNKTTIGLHGKKDTKYENKLNYPEDKFYIKDSE